MQLWAFGPVPRESPCGAELYRSYAAECLQIAQVITDHGHRARLIEMARRWRELADKAERTTEED
jgi:hypothetical protein